MKNTFKRILSLIMVLVTLGVMIPAVYADDAMPQNEPTTLTDGDYAIVNDVFAQIDAMEDAPAKKNATQTQLTDAAAQIVMASENYVEGSLERGGNSFTWWTDEGIRCIYNPYMREKYENMQAPADPLPSGIYNEPKATKGGYPTGKQVYLVAPYYGIDDTFTDQYKKEAQSIASAIGDTDGYTLYSGSSATVDKVADAIENGAVVIFDSHGTTDYDGSYVCDEPDGYEVYDYVSKADYSYLCLTNKTGLTTEDYNDGAAYFTDSEGIMCACVNGATIANHMEKNSPAGLLWMAMCLGMATDTICQPMREKGVEVVYGYSQSVSFDGDYLFEKTFWDNMIAGNTVAASISAMKSKWGSWDWSEQIANASGYYGTGYSLYEARKYYYAFPTVVSDEDAHPGQRNGNSFYGADSVQTVNSTYTLYRQYNITALSNNESYGSVSVNGNVITATPNEGYYAESATVTGGNATVSQNGNSFTVSASSDCTVQINFAAKTSVTVYFCADSIFIQHGYAGEAMSLPTQTAPEGYTFLGWTTDSVSEDTTEKPSYYTDSFVPTGDTTLFALYSYVDKNESSGTGDYVKFTGSYVDWSGEYLIVYEDGGLILDGSLSTLDAKGNVKSVTISNETISAVQGDPYKFTVEEVVGGYTIQSASGKYIGGQSGMNTLTSSSTPITNTLTLDASGNVNMVSNTSYLRYNAGDNRFRYYKSTSYSNQQPIALYVKDGSAGTTCYTTSVPDCPTHFVLSGLDAVVTPPSCTSGGYTTLSCPACGFSYTTNETPATGHNYEIGVCTTCGSKSLCVTSQPASRIAKDGNTAVFKVKATGEGTLKYQWQYRTSSSGSWQNAKASGNTTATLSVPASVSRHGYQYRCQVTDKYGNRVYTKSVTLYVLGIKTQPVSKTVVDGKTAKLTVTATGKALSYQWQYRTSSSGSWKTAKADGNKTKTLSIPASVSRHGYQYRCKITDSAGNVIYTKAVCLYVLGIKTQPTSKAVKVGATAKFTVAATGKGLSFQWQYRTSSSDGWKNAKADGSKTKTLSVPGSKSRNGYQYRCKITDSKGNVIYSGIVKLTIKK